MSEKYTHDELVRHLSSPGWTYNTEDRTSVPNGTLEKILRVVHERRSQRGSHDLIKEINTTIELDMIQIEKLWLHLGLPI